MDSDTMQNKLQEELSGEQIVITEFAIRQKDSEDMQSYGAQAKNVREIIEVPKLTKSPGQGLYMAGIAKLRDTILPIINLGRVLGAHDVYDSEDAAVLVAEINEKLYGFLIHDIYKNHLLTPDEIHPPLSGNIMQSYLTGIVLFNQQKKMFIIDLEKVIEGI